MVFVIRRVVTGDAESTDVLVAETEVGRKAGVAGAAVVLVGNGQLVDLTVSPGSACDMFRQTHLTQS